jgi:single-strand DNA-binding protein
MSNGLNRVTLLGTLGSDAELKSVPSGGSVLNMRIATNESYLDKAQVRQEKTEWHSVTLWGKRGESLAQYLTKGAQVYIEGSLSTRSYEKGGEKRYTTSVNAKEIILCGGARGGHTESVRTNGKPIESAHEETESDDIPF